MENKTCDKEYCSNIHLIKCDQCGGEFCSSLHEKPDFHNCKGLKKITISPRREDA